MELMDAILLTLKIFGVGSILGALGFLAAWYAFPPNLSVEEIKDKGKHNYESRLVVRNIGKMPASNIVIDVEKMNLKMGGLNMTNMNTVDCGRPIPRLAAGEKTELPAVPHVGMPVGSSLESCDYNLKLKYELRLPFISKKIEKTWHVELRNTGQDFVWQLAMV